MRINDGTVTEMDFVDDHHRLFYEFDAFIRMINEKDYDTAGNMLSISVAISELMEECRWKEGIIFSNDKIDYEK